MVAKVFVSGFVQNVGYRQFVKRVAQKTGLTGWVKNIPDGRVEAQLSGDQKIIEETIKKFWEGPFLSEVKSIDVEWIDEENFEGFEIIV